MLLRIYTDGAARGNPGKSASGYSVYSGSRILYKNTEYNGTATNNIAEYKAVINALQSVLQKMGPENDIEIYSDSKLMVNQIKGSYKVKDKGLMEQHAKAMKLLSSFSSYKIYDVPRENSGIAAVDKELNLFLDRA